MDLPNYVFHHKPDGLMFYRLTSEGVKNGMLAVRIQWYVISGYSDEAQVMFASLCSTPANQNGGVRYA